MKALFNKLIYTFLLYILLGFFNTTYAQELLAKVTVNAQNINSSVDKRVFSTLQTQLTNFLNARKWTNDAYKNNEKIECQFVLNLETVEDSKIFKGKLMVNASRPVFSTNYKSVLINYQDADVVFKYVEFQSIEFNENRVQGSDAAASNLTAIFSFYVYHMLGLHYNSFASKAGEIYFQKAQNIINNAPEGKNISGWKVFDGMRNRYWLNENYTTTKYNVLHDIMYTYYRKGLDKMADAEADARTNILQALNQLRVFNTENINTMFVQQFVLYKRQEIIGIYKKASSEQRTKLIEIMNSLDAANSNIYKEALQ